MKLQNASRVKLTQENNLFSLPCSVLEFKMSSNSVKLDSAKKWHRRLGHLNQADVVRNAQETVGNSMIYAMCAHWSRSQTLQYQERQTQSEEKLERVFTDVMGPFRVESQSGFRRFCIVFRDQYTKRDRDVSKLEPKALEGKFVVTLKETTDTWCTYPTHAR